MTGLVEVFVGILIAMVVRALWARWFHIPYPIFLLVVERFSASSPACRASSWIPNWFSLSPSVAPPGTAHVYLSLKSLAVPCPLHTAQKSTAASSALHPFNVSAGNYLGRITLVGLNCQPRLPDDRNLQLRQRGSGRDQEA